MIYQHLFDRVTDPKTVRAGLIGVGQFGTPIVTQAPLIPRLEIPVVADLDIDAGVRAFRESGIAEERISVCDSRAAALIALEAGRRVVLSDASLMMDLPLDVIATGTRVPESGARYAYEAIRHGKHVVMIDKEADSVVGPILKHLADRAGLVYTTDDGDEPGLLMGLVSWARSLGFEALCGGRLHSFRYDPATMTATGSNGSVTASSADRWALEAIRPGESARFIEIRRRIFADLQANEERGDPVCHLAVSANGTGLLPDGPVGRLPIVRLDEMPEALRPEDEGGIYSFRGVIDTPTLLLSPGEPDPGGGVFLIVANADRRSRAVMIEKGLIANSRGTAMLLYRPYHLCGAETAMSILCAGLLRVPTGSSEILPRVDIVATTTRDFKAGETIGSPGTLGWSRDLKAALTPAFRLSPDGPAPFFMAESARLKRDVSAGKTLALSDLDLPPDSVLLSLRRRQDERLLA